MLVVILSKARIVKKKKIKVSSAPRWSLINIINESRVVKKYIIFI